MDFLSDRYKTRLPRGPSLRQPIKFPKAPGPPEFIKGTSDWQATVSKAQESLDQYGYALSDAEKAKLQQMTEPGRGFWDGFWDFLDAPLNTIKLPWIMQQHTANRAGEDDLGDWLGMLGAIWSSNDEYITHYAPSLKEEDGSANLSSASLLKETFDLDDNLGTNIGTAAAGIALDIALDPLSWISWGTLGFGKGMARQAGEASMKVATKEATAVLLREAAEESLSPLAKRVQKEIVEKSAATRAEMFAVRAKELGDDASEEALRLARREIDDEVFRREYHMARRALGEPGFEGPGRVFSQAVEGTYTKGLPTRWDKSVRSSFHEEMVDDVSNLIIEKKFKTLAARYPEVAKTEGTHLWEGGLRLTTPFFRRKAGALNLGLKTDRKLSEPVRRVISNTWERLPADSRLRTFVRDTWRRRGFEVPIQEAARKHDAWRHSYAQNFINEQMRLLGVDNPQGDMKLILRDLDAAALDEGFDPKRAQELLLGLRTGDITPTILLESPDVPRRTTEAIIEAERQLDAIFKTLHGALTAFGDTVGNIEKYLPLIESADMKKLMTTVVSQGIHIPRDDMLKYASALESSDPVRAALLRNGAELLDLLISKATGAQAIAKESGDKVVADWTRFMNHRVIGTAVFSDLGGVTLMEREKLLKAFAEEAGRIGTNSHYLMNRAIEEALTYMNSRGANFKLGKGFEAFSTDLPDILDSYAKATERVVRFKAAIRAGEELALHRSLEPATEVGLTLAQHFTKYHDPDVRILIEEFAEMVDGARGKIVGHGMEKVSIGNGHVLDLPKGYGNVPELTRALGDAMEAQAQAAAHVAGAVDSAAKDVAALKNMGVPEEFAGELAGLVSQDSAMQTAVATLWDVYHERIKTLSSMTNELAGRRSPEEIAAALDSLGEIVAEEYDSVMKAARDLVDSWRKTVRLPGRVAEGTFDLTKVTEEGRHAGEWFAAKITAQFEKHLDQLASGSMDPQARKLLMDPETPLDVRLQIAQMKPQTAQQVETAGVLQTWSEARALITQANLTFDELVDAMGAEGTVHLLQTLTHLDGLQVVDKQLDDALRSMVTEFAGRAPIPVQLGDNLGDLDGIAEDYRSMLDWNLHPGAEGTKLPPDAEPITEAFAELRRQTQEQIRFLEDRGYEFVTVRGQDPYADVASLLAGAQTKNIAVHTGRQLRAAGPLMEPIVFGSGIAVPFIDAFDTLHRLVGHAPYGFGFDDAHGITSAWAQHIQAFEGEDVRAAFTTLTRSRRIAALKGGEYADLAVKVDLPDPRITQLFSASLADESMAGYQVGRANREGISEAVDITDAPGWNIDFINLAKQAPEDQVVQKRLGEKYALLPTEGMSKAEQGRAAAIARAWDRAKKGREADALADVPSSKIIGEDLYRDIVESLEEASKYGLNELGRFQVGFANSGLPELVEQAKQLDGYRAAAMTAWGKLPDKILSNQGGFMVTFRDGSAGPRFFATQQELEAFVQARVEAAQASFDAFSRRAGTLAPLSTPSAVGMTDDELARWHRFHDATGRSSFKGGDVDERAIAWQQARDQLDEYEEAGRVLGEPPADPNDLDVEATRMVEEQRYAADEPYYPASARGEDDRPPPLPRDPYTAKDLPVLGSTEGMDNLDPEILKMMDEDVTSARRAADRLPSEKDLMPTGQEIPSREMLEGAYQDIPKEFDNIKLTELRAGRGPVDPLKVTPEKGIITVGNDGVIRLSAQTERELQREMQNLRATVEGAKRAYQQGSATLARALKDSGLSLRELMEEVPSTLRAQGLKHPLFQSPTEVTPIMRKTGRPAAADQVADAFLTERQDQWRQLLAAAFKKNLAREGAGEAKPVKQAGTKVFKTSDETTLVADEGVVKELAEGSTYVRQPSIKQVRDKPIAAGTVKPRAPEPVDLDRRALEMADHWRAAQRGKIETLVNDNSIAGLFDSLEGVRVMGQGRGITHALRVGDWDAVIGEDGGETFRHILRLVGIDDSRLITMPRGDGSWIVRWGNPEAPLARIPSFKAWRPLLEQALGGAGPTLVRLGPDDLAVKSLRELLFEAKSKNIRVPGLEDLMELVGEKGHLPAELEQILHLDSLAARARLLGEGQRRALLDQQFESPLRKILDILDKKSRGVQGDMEELARLWEAHKADLSKWLPPKDWHSLREMVEQVPLRSQAKASIENAVGAYKQHIKSSGEAYATARSEVGNILNTLTVDEQNFWMPAIEGVGFFMNRYMSILERARTTEPERYKLDVLGGYFEPYYNQVYSQPLDQAHLAEEIADMNAIADRMADTIRTMPYEQKGMLHERLTKRLTELSINEGESLDSWIARRALDLERETDVVTFGSRGDLAGFVPQGTFHLATKELEGRMVEENFGLLLESLASHVAAVQSPLGIKLFKEQFNLFERWWKAAVTVGKPTFVLRNLLGGSFNNMAIDVGGREYKWLSSKAVKVRRAMRHMPFEEAVRKTLKAEDAEVFLAAHARKVFDTEFSADLITSPWKERTLNPFSADFIGFDYGGRFMQSSEDFLRMSAFKRWYDPSNPASADVAAALVNAVHFDYGNLTRLENSIKRFIPFYVWSRRNIPLQFRMLAENPGFTNRYNHLMANLRGGFYDENNPDNGLPIPGWMGSAAAAVGFNRHSDDSWTRFILSPDIPVRDLEQFLNAFIGSEGGPLVGGAEWLAGMTSPLIKVPVDLLRKSSYDSDVEAPWGMAQIFQAVNALPGVQFFYEDEDSGTVQVPAWLRSFYEGVIPFQRDWLETVGLGDPDPSRSQRLNMDTTDGVSMGERLISSVLSMAKAVGLRGATPGDLQQESMRGRDLIENVLKAPLAENRILQTEGGKPLGREDLAKIAGDPFAGGFGTSRAGGKGQRVKVARVVDGDTLVLEDGERIRVAFVNTPELGTPGGEAAKEYLMEAVMSGATIEVARDGWDQYAGGTRTVGEVWINGINLADALIGAGFGGYWRG